jgi:3-deoxy-D-manno-octulosonate 8-phosphate phosphatase (KDO 8-P phosphatase)
MSSAQTVSISVPGAIAEARAAADYITKREAGLGAVREICDYLIAARGNKPRR